MSATALPSHLAAALPNIKTPAYVADVARLKENLETAARIKRESGCKILLATKAFAMPAVFPLMRAVLDGTTASGLYEARLGREEFGKEVHVYAPSYQEHEFDALISLADDIYFNSPAQLNRFLPRVRAAGKKAGLRINPGFSNATLGGDLYNPCAPCSRFGALPHNLEPMPWDEIDILHTHVLCESGHEGSVRLIQHVAENFASYVARVKAVNFGGGHFINKAGYNVDALISAIHEFRVKFPQVEVILEPGAALVYDTGYLMATVLDFHRNEKNIAILDASASCHMPDVLEVPYTPPVLGAAEQGIYPHDYILAGNTCMAGDVIGAYSFSEPLKVGDKIIFGDMMQYSFVKNNSFNGTPLPDLGVLHEDGRYEVVRHFTYDDFRNRLG